MRIRVASLSVVMAAAFLVGACGAESDSSEQGQDSLLFFTCGNRRIDKGEQCDGSNLNNETCASATMGARPSGTLKCSRSCKFDTTGCKASGAGGAGGSGGSGGSGGVSTGGTGGGGTGGGGTGGSGGTGGKTCLPWPLNFICATR